MKKNNKKFPFYYKGRNCIFWAWKGNYINLGAGSELGIYYGGEPHWKVDKSLAMVMSMSLKYKGKEIISYRSKTWWLTGFNPDRKYLDVKASDLTVKYTLLFKNLELYKAFKTYQCYRWRCEDRLKIAVYTF